MGKDQNNTPQYQSTCFSCERSKPSCNSISDYCDHKCNVTQRCKMSTDLCLATMPSTRKWVFTKCFPLPAFERVSDYPHGHCSMKFMAGIYTCLCRGQNCNGNSTFIMANNDSSNALSTEVERGLQTEDAPDTTQRDEVKRIVLPAVFVLLICAIIVGVQVVRKKRPKRTASRNRIPMEELLPTKNPLELNLKEVIGRGSFGVVWRAGCRSKQGKQVAVKISKPERVTRWYSEKEIFSLGLCHPNVVSFIASEVRLLNGQLRFLIILEYIEGGDLRTFLKNNVVSIPEMIELVLTLGRGLSYLHSSRDLNGISKVPVAHRDLKTSNVLLKRGRECLITDFGLAVALTPSINDERITEKLQVGTPRYMSPEKLNSRINLLEPVQALQQIDIYALALTVYEIASRCTFEQRHGEIYVPSNYQLPFQEKVGLNPTTSAMREIVLENDERPWIPTQWHDNIIMESILGTIEECWDTDPDSRLTASCVVERMKSVQLHCCCGNNYLGHTISFMNQSLSKGAVFKPRDSIVRFSSTTTSVTLDDANYCDCIELV